MQQLILTRCSPGVHCFPQLPNIQVSQIFLLLSWTWPKNKGTNLKPFKVKQRAWPAYSTVYPGTASWAVPAEKLHPDTAAQSLQLCQGTRGKTSYHLHTAKHFTEFMFPTAHLPFAVSLIGKCSNLQKNVTLALHNILCGD